MASQRKTGARRSGGLSDFFWNIIGGCMVSGMLAGMIYVLIATIAAFLNGDESYWDIKYLKGYFAAVLFVYIIMPAMLAKVIGTIFGRKSKGSGANI